MFKSLILIEVIIWIIFNMFYGKHFGVTKFKSLLMSLFAYATLSGAMFFLAWFENGFKNFGEQNAIRAYVLGGLVFYIQAKLFKVDCRRNFDYQALWPTLSFGLGHLACISMGCCQGYQYMEGSVMYNIANALTGTNMLPNQLFESLFSLIIFVVLYIVSRKKNYDWGGRLLPLMLIIFGAQRFFWEFLRDNQKIIVFGEHPGTNGGVLGISNLAFWALATAVGGVIIWIFLNYEDKKKAKLENEAVAA